MKTLHIHLFGQLRLFWQERPYAFKALPKVKPILAYLLLNQDAPTVRDAFAFKLWPDVTEKQAKGRLRRHLYDSTLAKNSQSHSNRIASFKLRIMHI